MRLPKVLIVSAILSLILSLVGSFINYTPLSKREPNVYYFSISESFILGLMYITPIVLSLSIIAFFIYQSMRKMKRFSPTGEYRATIGGLATPFEVVE